MVTETVTDAADDPCPCQGKVPKEDRIDFLQWVTDTTGAGRWKPVLRYHKHCPTHGIQVTDAERAEPATV